MVSKDVVDVVLIYDLLVSIIASKDAFFEYPQT